MINCTGVDLVKLAQEAYRLSSPQGLGFLHFTEEPLSEEEAKQYIQDTSYCVLDMDYVHGRAVKLTILKGENNTLNLKDSWYDHTDEQYKELLDSVGIEMPMPAEHGCACNCIECRSKRLLKKG